MLASARGAARRHCSHSTQGRCEAGDLGRVESGGRWVGACMGECMGVAVGAWVVWVGGDGWAQVLSAQSTHPPIHPANKHKAGQHIRVYCPPLCVRLAVGGHFATGVILIYINIY